jgi:hypothetical protein
MKLYLTACIWFFLFSSFCLAADQWGNYLDEQHDGYSSGAPHWFRVYVVPFMVCYVVWTMVNGGKDMKWTGSFGQILSTVIAVLVFLVWVINNGG